MQDINCSDTLSTSMDINLNTFICQKEICSLSIYNFKFLKAITMKNLYALLTNNICKYINYDLFDNKTDNAKSEQAWIRFMQFIYLE